ncbi:hypothetical protein GUJ93_ZPchr0006g42998 [Zizania palustris]|uniref:DUF3475 domain-containing protein n=1 Tax=Zizania palustris TaxID=103762 RepID=A0A8J5S8L0_ZIZPA|nr:hypothetical protein GUJ93_ZPchr0006g42998 [Zizania palustris]
MGSGCRIARIPPHFRILQVLGGATVTSAGALALATMGGVCSAGIPGDKSPTELSFRAMGFVVEQEFKAFPVVGKVQGKSKTAPVEETAEPDRPSDQAPRFSPEKDPRLSTGGKARRSVSKEAQLTRSSSEKLKAGKSRTSSSGKVSDKGSVFGRASTSGIGKAVEVLDTLSSSMTSLSPGVGFVSGAKTKGSKVSILAFEVANTIVKGMSLTQSLSKESLRYLKETVLRSEGVQRLVSSDMNELMRIAAADKRFATDESVYTRSSLVDVGDAIALTCMFSKKMKPPHPDCFCRQELRVFSQEVIRFGNRCKDAQWHNLDRYFSKLESEIFPQPDLKEIAQAEMQQLMTLVRHTADLYHELNALDRFEQDYRRKLEEEKNAVAFERGDTVQIIRQELKSQRKHVHNLKKKSLWNKMLEDVMEKLIDIVHFLHVEIQDAFGSYDRALQSNESSDNHQTLGSAALSLHYANIISQIDNIVSRSTVPPQSTRDALYQGLPPNIKSDLRTKLLNCSESQVVSIIQVRSSMEKTLLWIVPVANNTARAHHGFGWVGEWANTGNDVMRRTPGQTDVLKIETFYHADKEKTEACILDLVVWLHHLVSYSRPSTGGRSRSPSRSPARSPSLTPPQQPTRCASSPPPGPASGLTREDRVMLQDVYARRRRAPGKSRSQELSASGDGSAVQLSKNDRLSKSSSDTPARADGGGGGGKLFPLTRRPSPAVVSPAVDMDIDGIKALDAQKRL